MTPDGLTGPERATTRLQERQERQVVRQRARRRQLADLHVLRFVPGTSPIHRCWAGSKIIALAVLSVLIVLRPTWASVGLNGVVVLVGFLLARLPRGVTPRLPKWVFLVLGIGGAIALFSGGHPFVHVGGVKVGVGGVEQWARFLAIGVEVLAAAALISWTTPLADLAPALGRLSAPGRLARLPVDEVVGSIALSIRCLPLLLEEVRVLTAARRTRRPDPPRTLKERADALEEMLFAALSSALRRARELAEAIEARGGTVAAVPETHGFAGLDAVVLVVVVIAAAGMLLLR